MKAKKGSTALTVIAILAILVIVGAATKVIDLGAITGGAGDTDDKGGVTSSTPSISFQCANLHTPSTSVSCGVWYKIGDTGLPTYDGDGVFSVSVGDKLIWMTNASGYYSEKGELIVPAVNTPKVPVKMLAQDTTPSIQIFNQDDGDLNSGTNAESLAANCNDAQTVKYFSTYKKGIKGATFVLDFVRTNIDDITSSLGSDIQEPDSLTHNTTAGRGSADTFRSFLIGDVNANPSASTSENREFTFTVDCGATGYGTTNMTRGLIDKDNFIDNNGGFSYGYEEPEANTDVGQSNHAFDDIFYTI